MIVNDADLNRGEAFAISLIPKLHEELAQVERKDQFWVAVFIALSAMAKVALEDDASELLHASVSTGVGDPGFTGDDSSESEEAKHG